MEEQPKTKNILKKWLDKLQEDSWNLELIISGFSIFGLVEARKYLLDQTTHLYANDIPNGSLMNFLQNGVSMVYIGINIFIIFLLIHVIFRGLWIGALGIRYVSGDIDYDAFPFQPAITRYLKKTVGTFDDFILRLERISSVVFGFTFLLIFVLFSFFIFISFASLVSHTSSRLFRHTSFSFIPQLFKYVILFIGILSVIDFASAGALKKFSSPRLAKVFIFINRFLTYLTLSFVWKPFYYNLIDQKNTRRLIYLIIPLVIFMYVIDKIDYNTFKLFPSHFVSEGKNKMNSVSFKGIAHYSINPNFYDNQRSVDKYIDIMSLPSQNVDKKFLKFFVKMYQEDQAAMLHLDPSIQPISVDGFSFSDYDKSFYEQEMLNRKKELSELGNKTKNESDYYLFQQREEKDYLQNLEKILNTAKSIYRFEVNNVKIPKDSIGFLFNKHIKDGEEGFEVSFPAASIHSGLNYLTLNKLEFNSSSAKMFPKNFTIPFYYIE